MSNKNKFYKMGHPQRGAKTMDPRLNMQPMQQHHIFDRDAFPHPCNNFSVGFDATFFLLGFSFAIQQAGPPPTLIINRMGDYVVSPQQALFIAKAMQAKIEEYEAQFGRIETPKASGLLVPNRSIVGPE